LRERKLAILLMTALLIFSAILVPASAQHQAPYRVITVSEYGLVYVYDVLPRVGESMRISFPKDLVKNLVNYVCLEDRNPKLEVEEKVFSIVVSPESGEQVHLLTIFKDVVFWNPAAQSFQLQMPLHPSVSGLGRASLSVEIRLPRDAQLADVSPGSLNQSGAGILSGRLSNIDLSSKDFQYLSVRFSSNTLKLIDIQSARLSISLPDRTVSLTLKILQLGGTSTNELTLRLPEDLTLIEVRDPLGDLSSSYEPGKLVVRLRQPLSGGEFTSFTVILKASEKSQLISAGSGVSKIDLLLPMNSTAWIYEVEVILKDAEIRSWSLEPIQLRREYPEKTILVYRFDHVDPISVKDLELTLEYEPTFTLIRLLPYLALASIALVIASVTAMYRVRAKPAVKKPGEVLMDESQLLMLSYQNLAELITSRRIYDRSAARRSLIEARSEVRRRVERIRKLGEEIKRDLPKLRKEVDKLVRSAEGFEDAVDRLWDMVYPYLSKSMTRKRLDEALSRGHENLKKAYGKLAESLEDLREQLS